MAVIELGLAHFVGLPHGRAAVEAAQVQVVGLFLGQDQLLWGGPRVHVPVHAEGVHHPTVEFCHAWVVWREINDVLGCHGGRLWA